MQVYCNTGLKETAQKETRVALSRQPVVLHTRSSSTPPPLAVIAGGLGIPHGALQAADSLHAKLGAKRGSSPDTPSLAPNSCSGVVVRMSASFLLAADLLQLQSLLHHDILQPQQPHLLVASSLHTAPGGHGFRQHCCPRTSKYAPRSPSPPQAPGCRRAPRMPSPWHST